MTLRLLSQASARSFRLPAVSKLLPAEYPFADCLNLLSKGNRILEVPFTIGLENLFIQASQFICQRFLTARRWGRLIRLTAFLVRSTQCENEPSEEAKQPQTLCR
jgi:hypothetical protein